MKAFRNGMLCLLLPASLLWGQDTQQQQTQQQTTQQQQTTPPAQPGQGGTLSGTVVSPFGVPVPNAAVTVTNVSSGEVQRTVTGTDGMFTMAVPPGTYKVEIEAAGFRRLAAQDVTLSTTEPHRIDLVLAPGDAREVVEVVARSPMIQTESAQIGRSFPTRIIRELPDAVDHNYQEIIGLMPGVTPPMSSLSPVLDPQRNRIFATNGQTHIANNWELNAANTNEPFTHIQTHVPAVESVEQMNLRTSNYNAEYGRVGASHVIPYTRPGTNRFHGSALYNGSVDEFNARDFYNIDTQPQAEFRSHMFGASVGGPILIDRLFFFGDYEGQYLDNVRSPLLTVPNADFRSGNFSGLPAGFNVLNPATGQPFPGNVINGINGGAIDPTASALLPFIPLPNLPGAGLENNFVGNSLLRNDSHRFGGRLDARLGDRTNLFGNYRYGRWFVQDNPAFGRDLGGGAESRLRTHTAMVGLGHTFSPNLLTDLRLSYNRYRNNINPLLGNPLAGTGISNFSGEVLPQLSIGTLDLGAPSGLPFRGVDNLYQVANTWAWNSGRHAFKFGADIRNLRVDGFRNLGMGTGAGYLGFGPAANINFGPSVNDLSSQYGSGSFSNAFAGFLTGSPTVAAQSTEFLSPTFRQWQWFGFVSDSIRITPNVNIELGLRYEVYQPVRAAGGSLLSNYDPATNTLLVEGAEDNGIDADFGRQSIDYQYRNFAPRVGFAWQMDNVSVLRGGYAISYFPTTIGFAAGSVFPAVSTSQFGVPGLPGSAGSISTPFPAPTADASTGTVTPSGAQPLSFVPQDRNIPYVQSFNATYQREIVQGMAFDLGYVGTRGRNMPYQREINAAAPGTGLDGMPLNAAFGRFASTLLMDTGAISNFDSFQAGINKRFAAGLSFTGAYTFSRAIDDVSNQGFLLDPSSRQRNRGLSDFHRKHNLVFSNLWQLPFGAGTNRWSQGILGQVLGNWQLNNVVRWASGTPFSVVADPVACACPGIPLLYGNNFGDPEGQGGIGRGGDIWFNRSAFGVPGPNTNGNSGRNNLIGPNLFRWNMSVFRSFPWAGRYKLEFRGEAYNLTNTPMFGNPVNNLNSTDFGRLTQTLGDSNMAREWYGSGRTINLGLRFIF